MLRCAAGLGARAGLAARVRAGAGVGVGVRAGLCSDASSCASLVEFLAPLSAAERRRVLMARVLRCKRTQELLDVAEATEGDFDDILRMTLFTRLATVHTLGREEAVEAVVLRDHAVMKRLVRALHTDLGEGSPHFRPFDLAAGAWAVTTLSGALGRRVNPVLARVRRHLAPSVPDLNPYLLSACAWAFAKAVVSSRLSQTPSASWASLSCMALPLGRHPDTPGEGEGEGEGKDEVRKGRTSLFQAVARHASATPVPDFRPRELGRLAWALAREAPGSDHTHHFLLATSRSLTDRSAAAAAAGKHFSFPTDALVDVLWAVGVVCPGHDHMHAEFARRVVGANTVRSLSASQLCRLACSFAVVRPSDRLVFDAIAREVEARADNNSNEKEEEEGGQDPNNPGGGGGGGAFSDGAWADYRDNTGHRHFAPEHLAAVAGAFHRAGCSPLLGPARLHDQVLRALGKFELRVLVRVLTWLVGVPQANPGAAFVRLVCAHVHARHALATPAPTPLLMDALWALVRLGDDAPATGGTDAREPQRAQQQARRQARQAAPRKGQQQQQRQQQPAAAAAARAHGGEEEGALQALFDAVGARMQQTPHQFSASSTSKLLWVAARGKARGDVRAKGGLAKTAAARVLEVLPRCTPHDTARLAHALTSLPATPKASAAYFPLLTVVAHRAAEQARSFPPRELAATVCDLHRAGVPVPALFSRAAKRLRDRLHDLPLQEARAVRDALQLHGHNLPLSVRLVRPFA